MAKEGLHKDFDTAPAACVLVSHSVRDLNLHVKGQLFSGATRLQMKMPAHGPEEILGSAKCLVFLGSKDAFVDQL